MSDLSPVKKILILSANPKGTTQLRLDEEIREIKEGLKRAKRREQFIIETAEAVRYRDIRRSLLEQEPQILHFSGHGIGSPEQEMEHDRGERKLSPVPEYATESGGLVFEDETGHEKLVDAEALAELFELFDDSLECVVLNACYSEVQARAIARHIDYVVGMNQAIGDKAAIEFAIGFYDALGAGKSYEFAYKLGCNAIAVAGIPDKLTPQLLTKEALACSSSTPSFYIERPPIEQYCYQAIMEPGALLRIKAPTKMGKTWLLERILDYASQQSYKTVKNVGVLIELPEFTQQQITELTQLYELHLDSQAVNSLIAFVGGNPYLVTRAFHYLKNQSISLEQLLQTASTEEGIYSDRLRQLLWSLQQNPQLKAAFEQVVTSSSPVLLDTERGFKLKSMGLVKLSGDGYLTSCDLYRQYFSVHLKDTQAGG